MVSYNKQVKIIFNSFFIFFILQKQFHIQHLYFFVLIALVVSFIAAIDIAIYYYNLTCFGYSLLFNIHLFVYKNKKWPFLLLL